MANTDNDTVSRFEPIARLARIKISTPQSNSILPVKIHPVNVPIPDLPEVPVSSGYSTPQSRLGRNMRAAPWEGHSPSVYSTPNTNKDTSDMRNYHLKLLKQQREQNIEESKLRSEAQQIVNKTLLADKIKDLQQREKDAEKDRELLDSSFPIAQVNISDELYDELDPKLMQFVQDELKRLGPVPKSVFCP